MSSTRLSRRSVLALAGAGLTSGCVRQLESTVSRDERTPLSLSIKTVPADTDATATRLARYLATRLQTVGVAATVVPMSREELLRDVLSNHDFDIYVSRLLLRRDPDFLRPLLHSRYGPGRGWQNPFGYGDLSLDSLLERQRTETGSVRAATLAEIQRRVVEAQPFTPVAAPAPAQATRPVRVDWPDGVGIHSLTGYLGARAVTTTATASRTESTVTPSATPAPTEQSTSATTSTPAPTSTPATTTDEPTPENELRMTIGDSRPTENLNPLSTPFRSDGTLLDLVYDSLGRPVYDRMRPWMAASWEWADGDDTTLSVRLRDDLAWHDGEPITAADVAFTFRFISDTALGSLDQPVPSPRYRGRASLVESVDAASDREVTIRFGDVSEPVAARALTIPVLPEHVWEPFARPTSASWLDGGHVTEALVRNNLDPVGSGPLRVTGTTARESVSMEPFEDHFLADDALDGRLSRFDGGFSFDSLRFDVVPSDGAAVELLATDAVDATANSLSADSRAAAADEPGISVRTSRPEWCYHVGYNHRRPPFMNPRFRRAVARLVDREFLVDSVFDGETEPASSPLVATTYVPAGDAWDEAVSELEFVGDSGTGTLDAERARSVFEDAGYAYSGDGDLLIQE
ncbi:ABC transporter substrate-binding protein [Haloferax sp. Atlit-4N]|uniref:ABC transporter substrate-binding protein n=1 Tax=Haloferax sp. Atlit-4N TaxID=2077206 RepID=UPI001F3E80FE|nr:ABC transporter substrate-binding protein [Haloferax sp. Atlit-4N]